TDDVDPTRIRPPSEPRAKAVIARSISPASRTPTGVNSTPNEGAAEDGGPSIAERLSRGSANKIHFRRADNTRGPRDGAMGGWDQLRARLVGDDEGRPMPNPNQRPQLRSGLLVPVARTAGPRVRCERRELFGFWPPGMLAMALVSAFGRGHGAPRERL